MGETRYFIFNHEAAFADCRLDGVKWINGAIRTISDTGGFSTCVLDSGESGNVWQRVVADMTSCDGARVIWRLYANEGTAYSEPSAVFTAENSHDFIPIGVCGRYAVLEAEIHGNVEIRSVQIYSAWESFLDYLPEIYRDYNGFTDRLLRLFTAQYLDLERKIGEMPAMLNPASAPDSTLRWLAEIAGISHISLWRTDGLRKLLVSGIYRRSGQLDVFADYIEYFAGYRPYIAEHFRYKTGAMQNDRLYQAGDVTVFLPSEAGNAPINMNALNVIISNFLPSDIKCRIIILNPYPVVSGHAYLGINTRIGAYGGSVVGKSKIGFSVVGGKINA